MSDLVQTRNPKTGRHVLIDRDKGEVLEVREEPYEGVPFAEKRTIKDSAREGSVSREEVREAVKAVRERR